MLDLIILDDARNEIEEATDWYSNIQNELGDDFVLELNKTFLAIRRMPKRFIEIKNGYRRALLKRFPYLVLFIEHDDQIRVIAMFHTSRDSTVWEQRIGDDPS